MKRLLYPAPVVFGIAMAIAIVLWPRTAHADTVSGPRAQSGQQAVYTITVPNATSFFTATVPSIPDVFFIPTQPITVHSANASVSAGWRFSPPFTITEYTSATLVGFYTVITATNEAGLYFYDPNNYPPPHGNTSGLNVTAYNGVRVYCHAENFWAYGYSASAVCQQLSGTLFPRPTTNNAPVIRAISNMLALYGPHLTWEVGWSKGATADALVYPIYYGTPPPPPPPAPPPGPCGFVPDATGTLRYVQANNGYGETFDGLTPGAWYEISVQPGVGDGGTTNGWFPSLIGSERFDVEASLDASPPRWAGWDDMDDTPPDWIACHHWDAASGFAGGSGDYFVGYFQATSTGKITVRVNDAPWLYFDNREGVYVQITHATPPPGVGGYYNVLGDSDMEQYPDSSYWHVPNGVAGAFGRVTSDTQWGFTYCGNGMQMLTSGNFDGLDFARAIQQYTTWYGGEMYVISHVSFRAGNIHPFLRYTVSGSGYDGTTVYEERTVTSPVVNGTSQWERYVLDFGNIPAGTYHLTISLPDPSVAAWAMLDNVIMTGDQSADLPCTPRSGDATPTTTPTSTFAPSPTSAPAPLQSCSFEVPISGWVFSGGAFASMGANWGAQYAFVPDGAVVSQQVIDTYPQDGAWKVSMWAYGSGEVWIENGDGLRQLVYSFHDLPFWTWFDSSFVPQWFVGNGVSLELHATGGAAGYDNVYMSQMIDVYYDVCDTPENSTPTPYPTVTGTPPTSTPTPNGGQIPTATPYGWQPTSTITPWPTATDWRTPTPFATFTPTDLPWWWGTPTPAPGTPTWTPSPTYLPTKTPTASATPAPGGSGGFPFPTGTPVDQPPPGAYAPCEKPSNALAVSGWIEYSRCRTLSYFAWGPPQSATAEAIPTVYLGDREPFGSINELDQTRRDVQSVVNQYSWSQGVQGMSDAPSFDVFLQPSGSWFVTGKPPLEQLANNSGVEPTYVCPGGDIEGMLGPLMTGICFAYGVLFDHGIMPWLQLLVDLGAILFFIVYLYHKWIDAGTGGGT